MNGAVLCNGAGGRLKPLDLFHVLANLDVALLVIGTAGGARIGFLAPLGRRDLMDDAIGDPAARGSAWWGDLEDLVDEVLPMSETLWGIPAGRVRIVPLRAALRAVERRRSAP